MEQHHDNQHKSYRNLINIKQEGERLYLNTWPQMSLSKVKKFNSIIHKQPRPQGFLFLFFNFGLLLSA